MTFSWGVVSRWGQPTYDDAYARYGLLSGVGHCGGGGGGWVGEVHVKEHAANTARGRRWGDGEGSGKANKREPSDDTYPSGRPVDCRSSAASHDGDGAKAGGAA